jgi:hypothetical protein
MLILHPCLVRVDALAGRRPHRDCHVDIICQSCESPSIRAVTTVARLAMTAFIAARPSLFYATTFMVGVFGGMTAALIWVL